MRAKHGPNHGHADRPRSVSNAKSEIGIVRLLVFPILHVVNNFGDSDEDIRCKGLLKRTLVVSHSHQGRQWLTRALSCLKRGLK